MTARSRRRPPRGARARLLVALLAGLGALTGCVALPESGPVVGASVPQVDNVPGPMYIDPQPPRAGDGPTGVVKGFLDAMLATPVQTGIAREFLTEEARERWDPQRTITFATASPPQGTLRVEVDLSDAHLLDGRGAWQGDLGDQTIDFGMVLEDGEWRVSRPPDALVVPERWYEQRYRQVSLYFFDPTAQILVPEPVFVPRGEQLASTLVRGLLAGPPSATTGFASSFFPPGLTAGLSVPVSADGIADIALQGSGAVIGEAQAELLVAQLTATLRQDPAIAAVRISIDGAPLDLPGGVTTVGLDRGEPYAPYVASASSLLYGLRDGVLVGGGPDGLAPVGGPFGTTPLGARSISPDLTATQAAAVSADGTALLLGPVREEGPVVQVLSGATDLLTPHWDFSGRLWLVDRTASGAQVLQRRGETARPLDVAGVTGADVRRMLVSRDGSRLVAVVRVDGYDQVVVSRILHDAQGRVLAATPAVRIDDPDDAPQRIRDIAWNSPVSLAVITKVNEALFQVRGLAVDGAPEGLGTVAITVKGDLRALAGSPVPEQPLWATGPGVLLRLAGSNAGPVDVDPRVGPLAYAG